MSARPDNWMPLYIRDYLADTLHLTRDQHGGYLLLIFAYWMRGGPLPDDDEALAAIVRAPVAEWRKRLRPVLAPFFAIDGEQWQHKRIDAEMAGAETAYAERVERTRAAREARVSARFSVTDNVTERGKNGKIRRKTVTGIATQHATGNVTDSVTGSVTEKSSVTDSVTSSAEGSVTKTQPQPQSLSSEREGARVRAALPPDWILPEDWREEAEKARERNGLPSVDLALAAERFAAYHEGNILKNWHGAWLKWALDEHADKAMNGHAEAEAKPLTAAERKAKAQREGCPQCHGAGWIRGQRGMVRCDHGASGRASP